MSAFEGLDYETKQSYDLMLQVSDGKDEAGNDDNWAIDDTIPLRIEITDVTDLVLSVSDTVPLFGDEVTWTASVSPLPAGATSVRYRWAIKKKYGTNDARNWEDFNSSTDPTLSWTANRETDGPDFVEAKVRVSAYYTDANGNSQSVPLVESDWVRWE